MVLELQLMIFGISAVAAALQNVTPSGFPVCSLDGGQTAVYVGLKEGTSPGTLVKNLPIQGISEDSETGIAPEIKLRLVSGTDWFTLDTAKKELKTAKNIDRDAGTKRLVAVVECQSLMEDFKVNFTIQVNIQDINDNAPIFEKKDYFLTLTEELPVGTPVFTSLKATDMDQEGPKSEILYEIVQDSEFSDLLDIPNPWEGTVVVHKRIDFESVANFTLTIRAKDNGLPSLSSTVKLHVRVEDADDLNPKFELDSYTAMVVPGLPMNSKLKIVPKTPKATDQDTLNAEIVYRISGAHVNSFAINPKTAEITLTGNVDSIEKNSLITIHAHQVNRLERQAQATLRVVISGPDSNKPRFLHSLYSADVLETARVGSRILQVSAMDPDKGSVLLYGLRNPEKYPNFMLNRETGVLSLTTPLDYEKSRSYTMRVEATDGAQTAEAMIEIKVLDVNDNHPEFSQPVYTFLPTGETGLVGAVEAIDYDGNNIRYHLLNFNDIFQIEPSGMIRVRNSRLLSNMTYELVVMAEDTGSPALQGHAVVRVDFTNTSKPLKFVVPAGLAGGGAMILIIALAALSLLLLILCFVLLIYLCQRRKQSKSANWRRSAAQRPQIGTLVATSNPPTTISLPHSAAYSNGGAALGRGGEGLNHTPVSRVNGLLARYEDAVFPGENDAEAVDRIMSGAYGPGDSPHGSQSPLHQDSNSSSQSGGYTTRGNECADRAMSISYRSAALGTENLRLNSDLLVTDALHPHMVTHKASNGSLDVGSNIGGRSARSTSSHRPPLTVYF